jgi:hypothetical protein
MTEQTITCQACGFAIPLSTALTKQIEVSVEARLKVEIEDRELAARAAFEKELALERVRIERDAKARVSAAFNTEVEDLRSQVTEKDNRLREAVKAELELRQRQRALADRERTMELEVSRRLDEQAKELATAAETRATEALHDDLRARDRQIETLSRQLEEMNRRLQQGSQQIQGEVAELRLEEVLAVAFPEDVLEPVPTGTRGADLCQVVRDAAGRNCGRIVWESKQTKAWSDGWLQKLRDDQAALRGDVGVIVSRALPEGSRAELSLQQD